MHGCRLAKTDRDLCILLLCNADLFRSTDPRTLITLPAVPMRPLDRNRLVLAALVDLGSSKGGPIGG